MKKILVVDDEELICNVLKKFLTLKGFEVFTALRGEEGLLLLEKEKPDLLIQDKRMQGIGGLGVLRELRKRKNDIPVVILTGSQDVDEITIGEIRQLGYDDFLFKPVDLDELLERINRRLKNEKVDEKKKVLIVDDETEIRKMLNSFFKKIDYEAISVESGQLGLNILSKENFDVLVSDIKMPFMDGVEFAKKAKALRPNMAIILLTGNASVDTAQEAIRIGINDYLTKPIDLNGLKSAVEKSIEASKKKERDADNFKKFAEDMNGEKEMLDSMKEEFIMLISHELRSPVTVISEGLSLLEEAVMMPTNDNMNKLSDDNRRKVIKNIETGRRRLINTMENIIYYTNLSKNNVKLTMVDVNLKDLIEGNFDGLTKLISEHESPLRKEISQEMLITYIDRDKMLDVLSRIIHNAAFHNPKGTEITLKTYPIEKGKKYEEFIAIEVSDNGGGFEQDVLQNIFTPFKVADINHHSRGIGLGLSICKKIIELHKGKIMIESENGKGTKVKILLPKMK
ncbi:MAG: response regulator [Pseudomonadota bacterium]